MDETNDISGGGGDGDLEKLPEDCISNVISLTSPLDSCWSSLVSTTFRSAAASDIVWDRFLPPDCGDILARAVDPVVFESKRDLYRRLSTDPVLIDGGNMSFALEKSSGRKCFMLSARELQIAWGDTPQYWRWIRLPESRFSEVAELLNVCWLEIHGKINSRLLSPKTVYMAYLIFKLVEGHWGLSSPPQEASVKVGPTVSQRPLELAPAIHLIVEEDEVITKPHARGDGWSEVELGDFLSDEGEDGDVDLHFMEVNGRHWKRGLVVQGIEVRPMENSDELLGEFVLIKKLVGFSNTIQTSDDDDDATELGNSMF